MTTPDPRAEIAELSTLRDCLRYAVSAFRQANLHHGHGATNALDEAAFLILESLHLPVDDFNAFADARLTAREKALLGERIAIRIEKRLPAAYITGRTYLHGFSFRADPRAIIPRSFVADLLFSPLFDGSDGSGLIEDPNEITSVLDLCTGAAASRSSRRMSSRMRRCMRSIFRPKRSISRQRMSRITALRIALRSQG